MSYDFRPAPTNFTIYDRLFKLLKKDCFVFYGFEDQLCIQYKGKIYAPSGYKKSLYGDSFIQKFERKLKKQAEEKKLRAAQV